MLVSILEIGRPAQGFNTSVSVFLLSVASIVVIDKGTEKSAITEEKTTQETMCNFICGLWVGGKKNPKILNMKIP